MSASMSPKRPLLSEQASRANSHQRVGLWVPALQQNICGEVLPTISVRRQNAVGDAGFSRKASVRVCRGGDILRNSARSAGWSISIPR